MKLVFKCTDHYIICIFTLHLRKTMNLLACVAALLLQVIAMVGMSN